VPYNINQRTVLPNTCLAMFACVQPDSGTVLPEAGKMTREVLAGIGRSVILKASKARTYRTRPQLTARANLLIVTFTLPLLYQYQAIDMALTRDFKKTVVARVERDPAFAKGLLDEAVTLFLGGEPETARVILRDLVNATLGFEQLAKMTIIPSKSLHRMLSPNGNPSMDNLAAIFGAICSRLKVRRRDHTDRARPGVALST
jgi:DNA-binding phage protein